MEIYLCDDNLIELAELKRLTDCIANETDRIYTCTTGESLVQMLENGDTANACVICDIELTQPGAGIRLAQELNHRYPQMPVGFCTGHPNYAKDLWNADFCSFLTKPVEVDALKHTLEKARKLLEKDFFTVTNRSGIRRIAKRDIRYIERRGRTSLFYLGSNEVPISTTETLEQLYRQLDSRAFFKIHRSYLVNLDHIARIHSGELTLYGVNIILTVSRPWQKKLIQALADHEGAKKDEPV